MEPCSDLASSFSPPVEAEEAVLDEEEVPEVDTVGEPDMNTTEEPNPAEMSCQESKDTISTGHLSNSPFYYFYQGQCNEILESCGAEMSPLQSFLRKTFVPSLDAAKPYEIKVPQKLRKEI